MAGGNDGGGGGFDIIIKVSSVSLPPKIHRAELVAADMATNIKRFDSIHFDSVIRFGNSIRFEQKLIATTRYDTTQHSTTRLSILVQYGRYY